jgi:hypothetical protein
MARRSAKVMAMFANEPRPARIWIRAVFQLADGRTITRTVRRNFILYPGDDERHALVWHELTEELQAPEWDFPEGHGTLVEVLGSLRDG